MLKDTEQYTYLDDVVIHSKTWDNYLQQLQNVLCKINLGGLTVNDSVCVGQTGNKATSWAIARSNHKWTEFRINPE